jgi:hypothetical protein
MKSSRLIYQLWVFWAFFLLRGVAQEEEIHYMSTGEDPAIFVKSKIEAHEVSCVHPCPERVMLERSYFGL